MSGLAAATPWPAPRALPEEDQGQGIQPISIDV